MAAERGHRSVPHTADLAVEAWAADREGCIAEAVRGAVAGFAEIPAGLPQVRREYRLTAETGEGLLVAALEEVIFRAETAGELPVEVELGRDGRLRLAMVDAALVAQVGAVPKAVSWHGLELVGDSTGWRCRVTLDV
jgi:SHS2 domain-containing protein